LKTVHDPEIPVNIFDLGLIYDVNRQSNGDVHITMSLTAPGCPVAGEMPGQVAEAVAAVDGVGKVAVELVWEPAWSPERMSDDAKMALDLGF
jgi:FeS assembly SUF system protein